MTSDGLYQCDFCWRDDLDDLSFKLGRIDGGKPTVVQVCSHCVADVLVQQRVTPLNRRERRMYRKAIER